MSAWWLLLLGCGTGTSDPADPPPSVWPAQDPDYPGEPLPPGPLLRRISLDLRGVPPTLDELDRLQADPETLEVLLEEFLADPRYGEHLVNLFAERWLTRVDGFNIDESDYHLDESLAFPFVRAVGEEPLRLLAHVAFQDLPWTEIVTGDYTIADDLLAQIWSLDYPEDQTGWQVARYTDGRPPGGVLMTNGLWWRYYTTPNNYNRTRAAALTRLLLCDDYLLRPISFEAPSILEREDVNAATREMESCAGCHSTLDPIASALFGFWWFDLYDPAEMTNYHPERERLGEHYLELAPAWYGTPMAGPADLGLYVAADTRFPACTVQQLAETFWRRDIDTDDYGTLQALEDHFLDHDLRLNDLIRALIHSDDYRVGSLGSGADEEAESRLVTRRLLSAEQLSNSLAELTGFRWTWEDRDELANDDHGYRILAGGLDGIDVTRPEAWPTLTRTLVIKRLGQAGADTAVRRELEDEGERLLFSADLDLDHRPGDATFDDELVRLHRRLFSESPDAERLADDAAFWQQVAEASDAGSAWRSLVAVYLRDPAFWSY